MAAREAAPTERENLLQIAQMCRRVPDKPAASFHEALQSAILLFDALMNEGWGAGMTFGRADQIFFPYYQADKAAGRLTKERAHELICWLLLKMNGAINLQSELVSVFMTGYPVMQGLTIGGVLPNGEDAVNDLSYLFLDAEEDVGLSSDDIVIRVNSKNPEAFTLRACEVAHKLCGKLKFVSDQTTIQSMLYDGIPIEYARQYISTGCHNPTVPSVSHDMGGVSLNLPAALELALNDGVARQSGKRLGAATGDPRRFESFDEVMKAYHTQFKAIMDPCLMLKNIDLELFSQMPTPLLSSFYQGCLQKGLDINEGGTWLRTHTSSLSGGPNVADGLAAIKKTVFDDKTLTMERLIDALDSNFEQDDEARFLLSKAPKFGNDDPYVDLLLKEVMSDHTDYIRQHTSFAGCKSRTGSVTMTANVPFGFALGATPDGRKAGEPISEGGISPHQGRNVSGPTATMSSVARVDQVKLSHGTILNMRLAADTVNGPDKLRKFAHMMKTFCEMGGNLVQFNFVSNEVLRDAQKHPENYRDLLVRVATYSAYFVELSKDLQDDIINRIEMEL